LTTRSSRGRRRRKETALAKAEVIARCLAALDACERACPDDRAVRVRVEVLRAIAAQGMAPRVAVVGRRGSGKSALMNALADAPLARTGDVADTTIAARVWAFGGPRGRFVWLDAPGFRAGGREGRLDDVAAAVRAFAPTVLVLCVAATEVDAAIDGDLDDLAVVMRETEAPRVALASRVDELEPPDVVSAPFDDPEKQRHIAAAVATLRRHLAGRGRAEAEVLPVCGLAAWRDGALTHDARWNLDAVAGALRAPPHHDLDALVRGLCEATVAHHAARAGEIGRSGSPRAGELLRSVGRALLDALDAVLRAYCGREGAALREEHGRALPGGAGEALRAGLDLVGAARASGAVAERRVRALGEKALAHEVTRVSPSARAAMAG
jgi:predicted GTPase